MVLRCSAGSTAPCTSYNRRRGRHSWAGPPRPPRCPTWVDLERGSLLQNGQSVRPGSCKSQRDYRTHPRKITHRDIKGQKGAKKGRNQNKELLGTQIRARYIGSVLNATANRPTVSWCHLGRLKEQTSSLLFSPPVPHWGQADLTIPHLSPVD